MFKWVRPTGKWSAIAGAGFVLATNDLVANTAQQLAAAQQQAALRARQQGAARAQAGSRGVAPAYGASTGNSGVRSIASIASLGGLNSALTAFNMDNARLPTTAEGLNALLVKPAGARNWRGPYISVSSWQQPLNDPWGKPYRYFNTTTSSRRTSFLIVSDGPDRVYNTADDLKISG